MKVHTVRVGTFVLPTAASEAQAAEARRRGGALKSKKRIDEGWKLNIFI